MILVLAYFNHQLTAGGDTWVLLGVLGAVLVCGVLASTATSQRGRSIPVSVGFLLCADAVAQAGGGLSAPSGPAAASGPLIFLRALIAYERCGVRPW
ncbi:MAG: methyl-accepting chemotaxis protein [Actinoplanes sp.]|nr:methyl-accepting chemotaxis protein [Actinoplanes sp.]